MKNLLKKLAISSVLQMAWIGFWFIVAFDLEYSWDPVFTFLIRHYYIIVIVITLTMALVEWAVYKIYVTKPLEKEKHKNIYMGINGFFIVIVAIIYLSFVSSG